MNASLHTTLTRNPYALALVIGYLALGIAYSVINPIHEATDELRHYRYVRYIADFGRLPVQSGEQGNAQAHHPPLYYATAALASFWVDVSDPLYEPEQNPHWGFRNWEVGTDNKNLYIHGPDEAWPYRDAALAAHVARWVTLLWGAGAVALTAAIALTVFPDRRGIVGLAGGLVAFNPMMLYLGAAVNNDVPAGLAGALITLLCLLAVRDGISPRLAGAIGAAYGAGLLVKFNLLAMGGVIALALLLAPSYRSAQGDELPRLRGLALAALLIGGAAFAIAGWWYIRNAILYGEPTGFLRLTEIWGLRDPAVGFRLAWRELGYAWSSLWGRFGYGQIPLPPLYYAVMGAVCGAALLGLAIAWLRHRAGKADAVLSDPARQKMLLILIAAVLVNFAVLYAYITVSPAGAMGRFFFPGLPAFATLVAAGLLPHGASSAGNPRQEPVAVPLLLALAVAALLALTAGIAPAYRRPAWVEKPETSSNLRVGDVAIIHAIEIGQAEVHPGDTLEVTVTWEVLAPTDVPYSVFVHLMRNTGLILAQRDTYPGLGNYPTTHWVPGHIFRETYRVFVPEHAYAPLDEVGVQVGLANPEHGRLPVAEPGKDRPRNAATRMGMQIVPRASDSPYPNPTFVNWDNKFALVGYEITQLTMWQGQQTTVVLYWQALQPPTDEDYLVFLQLWDAWEVKASANSRPVTLDGSTSTWVPGEVYIDVRKLRVPRSLPRGNYQLAVGWFSDVDEERLNIIAPDGRVIDDWLPLHNLFIELHPDYN